MFDFRYHALSLVAVFLALGIGILLGVTIGDSLVSEAERDLRSSLRGDVEEARDRAARAREGRERRERLIEEVFPVLAAGELAGERVAIVGAGGLPEEVESSVREAVDVAGGSIDSVSAVDLPDDLEGIEDVLTRRGRTQPDADEAERLGRLLARALVRGGGRARALQRDFPDDFRGDLRGADAAAIYRAQPSEPDAGDERAAALAKASRAFEKGLVEALKDSRRPVVGVEPAGAERSQVGFFKDRRISSVDNVDTFGGRTALVLALAGASGAFGYKDSADRPLPSLAR